MSDKTAQPKCPNCEVEGIDNIVSEDSIEKHGTGQSWFNVAFCRCCGHVYGVFTKHTTKPMSPPPKLNF